MNDELLRRLAACERRNRILIVTNVAVVVLLLIAACRTTALDDAKTPRSLTVSELNVVDHNGVLRAKLAGDFPDPIIQGQRRSRQSPAGGLLLFDDRVRNAAASRRSSRATP